MAPERRRPKNGGDSQKQGNHIPFRVVSEDDLFEAIEFGSKFVAEITEMQRELVEKAGVAKTWTPPEPVAGADEALAKYADPILAALDVKGKLAQDEAINAVKADAMADLCPEDVEEPPIPSDAVSAAFGDLKKKIMRKRILEGVRPDGRNLKQIRPLYCEAGLMQPKKMLRRKYSLKRKPGRNGLKPSSHGQDN